MNQSEKKIEQKKHKDNKITNTEAEMCNRLTVPHASAATQRMD